MSENIKENWHVVGNVIAIIFAIALSIGIICRGCSAATSQTLAECVKSCGNSGVDYSETYVCKCHKVRR